MFDDVQAWIRGNPQLTLWIIVALIVVIIILLYLLFTKKDGMRVNGRLMNPDSMTTQQTLEMINTASPIRKIDAGDTNAVAGRTRGTLYESFSSDVDRPNFWTVDPELREYQTEGMTVRGLNPPSDDVLANDILFGGQ